MKASSKMLGAVSLLAMSTVAPSAMAVAQTVAQADADPAFGEILVTARKRDERLQDVPLSISVLGADAIIRKNIENITDVASQTPGLTFDVGLVPSDTRIAIRGIQAVRGRPNVAILVDGIDTSSENFGVAGGGVFANLRLIDVERIEVVKGPQNVLYGRSAFAGAVNYVTKRSRDKFEADISGSIASFSTYDIRGSIGGPVAEGLSLRLNGTYFNTDGDYSNPNTDSRLNAGEVWGGAVALNYDSGSFNAYARLQYSEEKYSPRATVLLRSVNPITGAPNTADGGKLLKSLRPPSSPFSPPAPFIYTIAGDLSQGTTFRNQLLDQSGDPNNGGRAYDGTKIETLRATLALTYESDFGQFTSLTGYVDNKSSFNEDFDQTSYKLEANTPNPAYEVGGANSTLNIFKTQFGWPLSFLPSYGLSAEFDTRADLKQFSQELRWSKEFDAVRLTVDALYWHEDAVYRDASQFWLREGGNQLLGTFISFSQGSRTGFHLQSPLPESAFPQRITRTTDSYSLAGSVDWRVTDTLTATVEARVIRDDIGYTGFAFDPTPVNTYRVFNAANDPTKLTSNTVSATKFTPRVNVSYNNDQGLLVFATYAQGTKPGGIDTTDQNGDVRDGEFKPETVHSFELGGKFVGDNGRFILNGALFYNIYKDQQIGIIDTSGPVAISRTDNIGESTTKGFEIEGNWSPVDVLFLRAAYTYTKAEFTDYVPPRCSNVDSAETQTPNCSFNGKTVPLTPENQLNLSARFEQPISKSARAWIEVDTRFLSKRFLAASNLAFLPAYNQTDLRIGIDADHWRLQAWVENIFENSAPRTGSSSVDYGYFDLNSFNLPRGYLVALAPRRAFGVRAGYKF
jgi:outer membrane receptor protein involved in Fe transport